MGLIPIRGKRGPVSTQDFAPHLGCVLNINVLINELLTYHIVYDMYTIILF